MEISITRFAAGTSGRSVNCPRFSATKYMQWPCGTQERYSALRQSPGFKPMAQRGLSFRRSWVRCSWGSRPASQGTNVSSFSSAESANTIVLCRNQYHAAGTRADELPQVKNDAALFGIAET